MNKYRVPENVFLFGVIAIGLFIFGFEFLFADTFTFKGVLYDVTILHRPGSILMFALGAYCLERVIFFWKNRDNQYEDE